MRAVRMRGGGDPQVGQEDPFELLWGQEALAVEHQPTKCDVEFLRPQLGEDPAVCGLEEKLLQVAKAPRRTVHKEQAQGEVEHPGCRKQRSQEAVEAQACRLKGEVLAIKAEAVEQQRAAHQQRQGNGQAAEVRQGVGKQAPHYSQRQPVTQGEVDQARQLVEQEEARGRSQHHGKQRHKQAKQVAVKPRHAAPGSLERSYAGQDCHVPAFALQWKGFSGIAIMRPYAPVSGIIP